MAKVLGPEGGAWRVERHWLPRHRGESPWTRARRRLRGLGEHADVSASGLDLASVGDFGGVFLVIGVVILVVALLAFTFLVVLPVLLVLVDLLVVFLLAVLLVLGRVLFRRPWTVETIAPDGHSQEWKVVGWRESGELRRSLAERIEAGLPLPASDEGLGPS